VRYTLRSWRQRAHPKHATRGACVAEGPLRPVRLAYLVHGLRDMNLCARCRCDKPGRAVVPRRECARRFSVRRFRPPLQTVPTRKAMSGLRLL
jgi:hypothetical protein